MPTFVARSTTIHLCTTDKVDTNSSNLCGNATKDQLDSIAYEFKKATVLPERPLRDGGFQLRFIGNDKDMPFYMVLAGKGIGSDLSASLPKSLGSKNPQKALLNDADSKPQHQVDSSEEGSDGLRLDSSGLSTTRGSDRQLIRSPSFQSASDLTPSLITLNKQQSLTKSLNPGIPLLTEYNKPIKPQALCLTIAFTKESFIKEPYVKTGPPLDVKIDVFFNGVLSASTYVSERNRNSEPGSDELTYRLAGLRVAQKLEKPWVLVPPTQNANGTSRNPKRTDSTSKAAALSRWTDLRDALSEEAVVDKRKTLIGQYLASLSELEMPPEIECLHNVGCAAYGVIDVVLTAGRGSKKEHAGIEHISEPTRMHVVEPRQEGTRRKSGNLSKGNSLIEPITLASKVAPRPRSFADAHIVAQGYTDTRPREARKVMRSSKSAISLPRENIQTTPHTQLSTRSAIRETRGNSSLGQRVPDKTVNLQQQSTLSSARKSSRIPSGSRDKPQRETPNIPQKTFKGSEPALEERPKPKRARLQYHSVLSTKLTMEEEIAQIEAQSKKSLIEIENPAKSELGSSPAARRHSARRSEYVTPESNITQPPKAEVGSSPSSSTLGKRRRTQTLSIPRPGTVLEQSKTQESVPADSTLRSKLISLKVMERPQKNDAASGNADSLSPPFDNEEQHTLASSRHPISQETPSQSSGLTFSNKRLPHSFAEGFGINYAPYKLPSGTQQPRPNLFEGASDLSTTIARDTNRTNLLSMNSTSSLQNTLPPPYGDRPSLSSSTPNRAERANRPLRRQPVPNPSSAIACLTPSTSRAASPTSEPTVTFNGASHPILQTPTPVESTNRLLRHPLMSNPGQIAAFHTPSASRATTAASTPTPRDAPPSDPSRRTNKAIGPLRPWTTPTLSKDCVITFAPEGLRPVKLERTGWFKEQAILMGVRFVVR